MQRRRRKMGSHQLRQIDNLHPGVKRGNLVRYVRPSVSYGISVSIKIYTSPFVGPDSRPCSSSCSRRCSSSCSSSPSSCPCSRTRYLGQPDKFHYPASKPRRDISKAFKNCPSVVWGQHLVIGSREDNSNRSASSVSLLDEQCIIFSVHVGPGTRSA